MSQFVWYWHRLRAMSPAEVVLRARKKLRQFSDARWRCDGRNLEADASGAFPPLPDPEKAPEILREALKRDAAEILAGRWKAFGHLELRVDDPPLWQKDYLADRELRTRDSAFKLNHRSLPGRADIKLIWELSRWHQLVRLAMAACVLNDERAARKCLDWLEDWVKQNPPYQGWNWTSALEVGIRLIQFAWIDALLSIAGARTALSAVFSSGDSARTRLSALRQNILGPHARYAWRHRSFGSSANNHLLGELAGLIVASARYPALTRWSAPLDRLQQLWEREVLAQFAEDGGNMEQALNYHLFSWEFCWQARRALITAGRRIAPAVEERLSLAAEFFGLVQVEADPWDYGDSDNAFVTPFFADARAASKEWRNWMRCLRKSDAIGYWWGAPPAWSARARELVEGNGRIVYPNSQVAIERWNSWVVRFDASPLGYLTTAAHGHLDALHISIWYRGVAIIVDPGTGVYYPDPALRAYLASWQAHNGPCPAGLDFPKRMGAFLWADHHAVPRLRHAVGHVLAELDLPVGTISRRLVRVETEARWVVEDSCILRQSESQNKFTVRWQFPPGSWVKRTGGHAFSVHHGEAAVQIQVDENWEQVELVEPVPATGVETREGASFEGIVSPVFRELRRAPFLKLTARAGDKPCVFRTTFLASAHS